MPEEKFYRYCEEEFVFIPAKRLKAGDMLALGNNSSAFYGTVTIENIARGEGLVVVRYYLPDGAIIHSGERIDVQVDLTGKTPVVNVWQAFDATKLVMVRRKG